MMYSRVHGLEDKIGVVHEENFGSCMELESLSRCRLLPLSLSCMVRFDSSEEGI